MKCKGTRALYSFPFFRLLDVIWSPGSQPIHFFGWIFRWISKPLHNNAQIIGKKWKPTEYVLLLSFFGGGEISTVVTSDPWEKEVIVANNNAWWMQTEIGETCCNGCKKDDPYCGQSSSMWRMNECFQSGRTNVGISGWRTDAVKKRRRSQWIRSLNLVLGFSQGTKVSKHGSCGES